MKKPKKYNIQELKNLQEICYTMLWNYTPISDIYLIIKKNNNPIDIHREIKNSRKTIEYSITLSIETTDNRRQRYTIIYNIIYQYSLKQLILYLNTEFELLVHWRYSLGRD